MASQDNRITLETNGYCYACQKDINLVCQDLDSYGCFVPLQELAKYLKIDIANLIVGSPLENIGITDHTHIQARCCMECSEKVNNIIKLIIEEEKIKLTLKQSLGDLGLEMLRGPIQHPEQAASCNKKAKENLLSKMVSSLADGLREEIITKTSPPPWPRAGSQTPGPAAPPHVPLTETPVVPHLIPRRHACQNCPEEFATNSALNAHMPICPGNPETGLEEDVDYNAIRNRLCSDKVVKVVDNKKWKCLQCSKEITEKRAAQNHYISKHLDMKIYKCNFCEKGFTQESYLQDHKKTCEMRA